MLVGNKIDLVKKNPSLRKVSREEAQGFANKNKLLFEETSAVSCENVNSVFEKLLEGTIKKYFLYSFKINYFFTFFKSILINFLKEICKLKNKKGGNVKTNDIILDNNANNLNMDDKDCKC